jgi:hypothetical protein
MTQIELKVKPKSYNINDIDIVKSHCNDIFKSFTENDIKFIGGN